MMMWFWYQPPHVLPSHIRKDFIGSRIIFSVSQTLSDYKNHLDTWQ